MTAPTVNDQQFRKPLPPTVASALRADWNRITAVAWKDLTAERRTKSNFNAVVAMAGLILLFFGFALGPDAEGLRNAAAGVLWLTILFSGVQSFF